MNNGNKNNCGDSAAATQPNPLILASASPRRSAILRQLGLTFEVIPTDAPEIADPADPVKTVLTNALAKLDACRATHPHTAIIAADTLVWFEGRLLGKPRDLTQAAEFLASFSGKTQLVFTGVAYTDGSRTETRAIASGVTFRVLSAEDIQAYISLTHPLDRAGAYDINEHGELIIASHSGSYTNIMGLPEEVIRDLVCRRPAC